MKSNSKNIKFHFLSCCILILLASCASRKDVVYLQDTGDFETIVADNVPETKFKVDDLVSIHISSLNPEASAPFNLYRGGSGGGQNGAIGTPTDPVDYLVDQNGMIDFPVLGKLKISGLSPDELRTLLRNKLADFLKDPIINIQIRNFTITVLGAVASPGSYPVLGEQITILEALGLAGDMTPRGKRDNVLVIRNFEGAKVYTRLDLTSKEVLKSPAYYITQNDIIYVEPNKTGIRETSIGSNTALTVSIISLLITTTAIILTRTN
ncbi:polysaccharide biosynthesis/export family protein [Robiginitalea aurantiaca]|uniref:Polysaccharide biosynthesis/export family protein n=1 Tax=Robiginitalea aurantiaca TaxID=3056915 RepID=A0ABT7WIP6_9FLAO|nr:polysaccharide biosynthesis/export family protein [Robiginitalea aurantiaca]MDM9632808.1 polysaccharide biosynthesis/export family protein [Robiginitalea aurantiaca]